MLSCTHIVQLEYLMLLRQRVHDAYTVIIVHLQTQVLHNMGRALESKIQSSSDGGSSSACCDTDALLHEAAVCWQEAVTLNPLHVEALFARGYALHQVHIEIHLLSDI
jgi:hypothetical protein